MKTARDVREVDGLHQIFVIALRVPNEFQCCRIPHGTYNLVERKTLADGAVSITLIFG